MLRGLFPLAYTSLESNPWTTVLAVDASEWSKGVASSIWQTRSARHCAGTIGGDTNAGQIVLMTFAARTLTHWCTQKRSCRFLDQTPCLRWHWITRHPMILLGSMTRKVGR